MKTVILAMVDCGDGCGNPEWFEYVEVLEQAKGRYAEELWMGDRSYHFPDDFDFAACGITFSDQDWLDRMNCEAY